MEAVRSPGMGGWLTIRRRWHSFGVVLTVGLSVAAGSCSKNSEGSPTGPTAVGPTIESSCTDLTQSGTAACPAVSSLGVGIRVTALDGPTRIPFSYTFAGLTVTGTGTREVEVIGLAAGDYEIAGPLQQQLIFTVIPLALTGVKGGFVPNSIQSLEGPVQQQTCQGVTYQIPAGGTKPQTFRFKFTITSNVPTFCS
jgi:hypothetical protein